MKELESSRVKLQPDAILRAGMSGREAVEAGPETYPGDPCRCFVAAASRFGAFPCAVLLYHTHYASQIRRTVNLQRCAMMIAQNSVAS